MFLITEKETNSILDISNLVTTTSDGYYFSESSNTFYLNSMVNLINVDEIPSDIEVIRHCYTKEDGFYPNPNWLEPNPYGIPNELYNQIIDDYTEELINDGIY